MHSCDSVGDCFDMNIHLHVHALVNRQTWKSAGWDPVPKSIESAEPSSIWTHPALHLSRGRLGRAPSDLSAAQQIFIFGKSLFTTPYVFKYVEVIMSSFLLLFDRYKPTFCCFARILERCTITRWSDHDAIQLHRVIIAHSGQKWDSKGAGSMLFCMRATHILFYPQRLAYSYSD